ncbi:HAD family hydrolase [Gorillibacterium massiliense]|uniref:HAD family hydrolase n=1 Tax=Gorillibacterium massiliense TaxID=1280390 RepID=UPI0004BA2981|nr:HAD hydrolase-like protein [Gorillibacterium massiliense]
MTAIQEKLEKPDAMIFDMDGTLFKTESILLTAYHRLFDDLRKEGLYSGETPPEERILGGLGMLLEDIWKRVMPDSPREVHQRADELLLYHQLACLKLGEGELYPGVAETLQALHHRGIRLFVASNGLEDYVKRIAQHKGVAPLFENLYSAGEYLTRSKVDLVKLLLDTHGISSAWMVGDRSSDVEAGKKNGLKVIGCDYAGFGGQNELAGSDVRISAFPKLLDLLADEN